MNKKLLEDVMVTIFSAVAGQPDFTFKIPAGTVVRDTLGREGLRAEIQWGTAGTNHRHRLYAMVPVEALSATPEVPSQSLEDMWNQRPCE